MDSITTLPRRDSALSSSISSTKSDHMRQNMSHRQKTQSSRSSSRSSKTHLVPDPSRRTGRSRRIRSSSNAQIPHTNVAEAIALHERSCAILQSGASSAYSSSPSEYDPSWQHLGLTRAATLPYMSSTYDTRPRMSRSDTVFSAPPNQIIPDSELTSISERANSFPYMTEDEDEEAYYYRPLPETKYWTSTETRRREYAEIDRANKGIRGLFKKLFPKVAAKSGRSRFYDEKEGSMAGSVRRYRLDLPDEDDTEDDDCSTYEASCD